KSDKREESLYMAAYCKYLQAPPYYLDQSTTKEAINELELFTDVYPQSELIVEANKHIGELQDRLEKKEYHKATMYHQMEDWESAAYALEVFLNKYPVTEYREEALFKILNAHYNYAEKSIQSKKQQRYQKVMDAYDNLIAEFPDSEYKNKADRIKEKSIKVLDELKSIDKS
ncbi:MAG: outer membrane protein assembly factor BamD, partial [Bacteroidota bacterium]